jgi:hypothetical protein
VYHPRDDVLSDASLARHEHGRARRRGSTHELAHLRDRRRPAHESAPRSITDARAQHRQLFAESGLAHRITREQHDVEVIVLSAPFYVLGAARALDGVPGRREKLMECDETRLVGTDEKHAGG